MLIFWTILRSVSAFQRRGAIKLNEEENKSLFLSDQTKAQIISKVLIVFDDLSNGLRYVIENFGSIYLVLIVLIIFYSVHHHKHRQLNHLYRKISFSHLELLYPKFDEKETSLVQSATTAQLEDSVKNFKSSLILFQSAVVDSHIEIWNSINLPN